MIIALRDKTEVHATSMLKRIKKALSKRALAINSAPVSTSQICSLLLS